MHVVRRRSAKFLLNDVDITSRIRDVVVCASPSSDKCFVTVNYSGEGVRAVLELLAPDSTLVIQEADGITHRYNFDASPTLRLPAVISRHVTACVFECPAQPPAVWRPHEPSTISG